jgi:hypothetical protein
MYFRTGVARRANAKIAQVRSRAQRTEPWGEIEKVSKLRRGDRSSCHIYTSYLQYDVSSGRQDCTYRLSTHALDRSTSASYEHQIKRLRLKTPPFMVFHLAAYLRADAIGVFLCRSPLTGLGPLPLFTPRATSRCARLRRWATLAYALPGDIAQDVQTERDMLYGKFQSYEMRPDLTIPTHST